MTSSAASAIFRRTDFTGRTDKYAGLSPNPVASAALSEAMLGMAPVDVAGSILTDPYVQDSISRLSRYRTYVDFYAGRHHTVEYDGGDKKPVFNFPRRIINKRARWIVGKKGFQFIPRKGNEAVTEVLDAVWSHNRRSSLLRRTAKVSLTTGDGFWYFTVRSKDASGNELPREQWTIQICPVNPGFVFPLWSEEDPTRMRACMLQFPVWGSGASRTQLFTAVYTPDTVEMYRDNVLSSKVPNKLGIIPIVHIPNEPYDDMPFGISALHDLIPPIRAYTETMMRISRIIKYHADPTTVVYGTSLANMEKAANRVWSNLPPPDKAKVDTLEMRGDLAATYKAAEEFKDEIHLAASTPQIAFDAKSLATSNSSGLAIQLLFQPLIEVTTDAQDEFSEAIRRGNEIIATIYDKVFGQPLSILSDSPEDFLATDFRWPSMMPRDEQQEILQVEKLLTMKLISKAEAVRRIGGITDTERNALEISADGSAELAWNMETARVLQGQTPNLCATMMGSIFLNEELVDIMGELGHLTDASGDNLTGKATEPDDSSED